MEKSTWGSHIILHTLYRKPAPILTQTCTHSHTSTNSSTFTFTFRAFSRRFYLKRLTISTFVSIIYCCWCSPDIHRNKSQAVTIARLINSPNSTKIASTTQYYISRMRINEQQEEVINKKINEYEACSMVQHIPNNSASNKIYI